MFSGDIQFILIMAIFGLLMLSGIICYHFDFLNRFYKQIDIDFWSQSTIFTGKFNSLSCPLFS